MAVAEHVAHHPVHNRLAMNRAGLWLFFFSESVIFGLLLAGRFFLAGTEREHLNQELGLLVTSILLLSSLSAYAGETAIERGNIRTAKLGILATIVMGLVFAVGVGFEWSIAEFPRNEPFGTAFFSMTGMHAFHVMTGVAMLALVYVQVSRGRYTAESHWPVSATVMYWHFVDVVWVFFYPALYLIN